MHRQQQQQHYPTNQTTTFPAFHNSNSNNNFINNHQIPADDTTASCYDDEETESLASGSVNDILDHLPAENNNNMNSEASIDLDKFLQELQIPADYHELAPSKLNLGGNASSSGSSAKESFLKLPSSNGLQWPQPQTAVQNVPHDPQKVKSEVLQDWKSSKNSQPRTEHKFSRPLNEDFSSRKQKQDPSIVKLKLGHPSEQLSGNSSCGSNSSRAPPGSSLVHPNYAKVQPASSLAGSQILELVGEDLNSVSKSDRMLNEYMARIQDREDRRRQLRCSSEQQQQQQLGANDSLKKAGAGAAAAGGGGLAQSASCDNFLASEFMKVRSFFFGSKARISKGQMSDRICLDF